VIDIHSHILPGIDDGASDLNESVAMCRRAAEQGCTAIVATPHQRTDRWSNENPEILRDLVGQVRAEVGDTIEVFSGGEIRIDSELVRELSAPDRAGLMTLAESDFLLLEFDRHGHGPPPLDLVYDIVALGYQPIIAHPEFIPHLASDFEMLEQMREAGALFQITGMSVTGEFGGEALATVEAMLDAELADIVASDAHTMRWRPPGLTDAYHRVASRWGARRAERLFRETPGAVTAGSRTTAHASTETPSTNGSD